MALVQGSILLSIPSGDSYIQRTGLDLIIEINGNNYTKRFNISKIQETISRMVFRNHTKKTILPGWYRVARKGITTISF